MGFNILWVIPESNRYNNNQKLTCLPCIQPRTLIHIIDDLAQSSYLNLIWIYSLFGAVCLLFAGKRTSGEQDVCLEKQVERFEWQLRNLREVLSANGNQERAELLKEHADEDVCALVLSILDKVRRWWSLAILGRSTLCSRFHIWRKGWNQEHV